MSAPDDLRRILSELPPEQLAEVRALAERLRARRRAASPIDISDVFGTLSADSAAALEKVIVEGCERLDGDTW